MRVDLCMNPDLIRALYDDPFVQDRYADSAYYGFIDDANVFYLVGSIGGNPELCAMCIHKSVNEVEIHLCIPSSRKFESVEFCKMVIDWVFEKHPCHRIRTSVVCIFPEVLNFVRKLGFSLDGRERQAVCRDGEFIDLWVLSLIRGEPYGRR
jgi:hypothetical protein